MRTNPLTPRGTRYGIAVVALCAAIAYALIWPDVAECAYCGDATPCFINNCLSGCQCLKKPGEVYGVCISLSGSSTPPSAEGE